MHSRWQMRRILSLRAQLTNPSVRFAIAVHTASALAAILPLVLVARMGVERFGQLAIAQATIATLVRICTFDTIVIATQWLGEVNAQKAGASMSRVLVVSMVLEGIGMALYVGVCALAWSWAAEELSIDLPLWATLTAGALSIAPMPGLLRAVLRSSQNVLVSGLLTLAPVVLKYPFACTLINRESSIEYVVLSLSIIDAVVTAAVWFPFAFGRGSQTDPNTPVNYSLSFSEIKLLVVAWTHGTIKSCTKDLDLLVLAAISVPRELLGMYRLLKSLASIPIRLIDPITNWELFSAATRFAKGDTTGIATEAGRRSARYALAGVIISLGMLIAGAALWGVTTVLPAWASPTVTLSMSIMLLANALALAGLPWLSLCNAAGWRWIPLAALSVGTSFQAAVLFCGAASLGLMGAAGSLLTFYCVWFPVLKHLVNRNLIVRAATDSA